MKKHLILLSALLLTGLALAGCSNNNPGDGSGTLNTLSSTSETSAASHTVPQSSVHDAETTTLPAPGTTSGRPKTTPSDSKTDPSDPATSGHPQTEPSVRPQTSDNTNRPPVTNPHSSATTTTKKPPAVTTPETTVSIEVLPSGTLPSVNWNDLTN